MSLFISLFMSFLMGSLGAFCVSRLGFKFGLCDRPTERSSHLVPTPKGGGIGIAGAFLFLSLSLNIPIFLWGPAILLSFLSLVGDKCEISPLIRLVFQFAAALIVLVSFFLSSAQAFLHQLATTFFNIPTLLVFAFLAVFVVGTANFYNFMDGINGIAGITGVVAFGLLGGYAYFIGADRHFVQLSWGIACACAGFLPWNIPKAKVFMGDVGSILLGFVFATLLVVISKDVHDFFVGMSFLFLFYADELFTMYERIKDGEKLTKPHRRHLYQILANEAGIAHWKISLGYGFCQLFCGIVIWIMRESSLIGISSLLFLFFILFGLVNNKVKCLFLTR